MSSLFRSKLYPLGRAVLIAALAAGIHACHVKEPVQPAGKNPSLQISESFNFFTTNEVTVTIAAKDGQGKAVSMSNIQLFDKDPQEGGTLLLQGV